MLKTKEPVATVAVKNFASSRPFYEDKLGLTPSETGQPDMAVYRCGNASLLVYQSDYAGSNQATAVTWMVGDDLAATVKGLKGKGIAFESYDFPDVVKEGDIHVFGSLKTAWFKDPDGNIHSLVNG
jgi:catechol 2,3-dioxygenase-like lactoylglutathione lyase family enzyme